MNDQIRTCAEDLFSVDDERKSLWNQGMKSLQDGKVSEGLDSLQKSNELWEKVLEKQKHLIALLDNP